MKPERETDCFYHSVLAISSLIRKSNVLFKYWEYAKVFEKNTTTISIYVHVNVNIILHLHFKFREPTHARSRILLNMCIASGETQ